MSNLDNTMNLTSYLVIGPHFWGQGLSLVEARDNFRKQGGRLGHGYTVIEFPPSVEFKGVDQMGTVHWAWDDTADRVEPIVTEHPPRVSA